MKRFGASIRLCAYCTTHTATPPAKAGGVEFDVLICAALPYRAAPHQIDDRQQHNRADERNQQRGQIEGIAVNRWATQQEAADHRADNPDDDVEQRTLLP